MIKLSKKEVAAASNNALLCVNPGGTAIVLERQADGGVDDVRIQKGADFFSIDMVKHGETYLDGGEWATIPYVRNNGKKVTTNSFYRSFEVDWVD